jgi:hypothetical protein
MYPGGFGSNGFYLQSLSTYIEYLGLKSDYIILILSHTDFSDEFEFRHFESRHRNAAPS